MRSKTLAKLSGRPRLVTIGLCTVAGTALMLGAVVGLMLAGTASEPGRPTAASASAAAPPDAIAGRDPAAVLAIEAPDEPTSPQGLPGAASAAASAAVPATASIGEPEAALCVTAGAASRPPPDGLPLDLGPRVAHALAALEPTTFLVQAGSFSSERHAAMLVETIAAVGAPVRVAPSVDAGGSNRWLVAAGPFADAATATATAADIRRAVGVSPLIRTLECGR